MNPPLAGVRVVEVASHVFVPMAGRARGVGRRGHQGRGSRGGDPYRGLATFGLHNVYRGVDPFFQSANRGKRSVGIDLKHPAGGRCSCRLVGSADVFMTNLRSDARRQAAHRRGRHPARQPGGHLRAGHRVRTAGPDAGRGGYDAGAYWARSGMQHLFRRRRGLGDPVRRLRRRGGHLSVAGAVERRAVRRARPARRPRSTPPCWPRGCGRSSPTWSTPVWTRPPAAAPPDRHEFCNPLWQTYRTADGRFVALTMVAPDPHWPDLCRRLGVARTGRRYPRFVDAESLGQHAGVRRAPRRIFAAHARPVAAPLPVLGGVGGGADPRRDPHDPQVRANGFVAPVDMGNDVSLPLVTAPVQFDGRPASHRAPEPGEHTEAVLLVRSTGVEHLWVNSVATRSAGDSIPRGRGWAGSAQLKFRLWETRRGQPDPGRQESCRAVSELPRAARGALAGPAALTAGQPVDVKLAA